MACSPPEELARGCQGSMLTDRCAPRSNDLGQDPSCGYALTGVNLRWPVDTVAEPHTVQQHQRQMYASWQGAPHQPKACLSGDCWSWKTQVRLERGMACRGFKVDSSLSQAREPWSAAVPRSRSASPPGLQVSGLQKKATKLQRCSVRLEQRIEGR